MQTQRENHAVFFALIKDSSALKTNITSWRQDVLHEIPLQFAICKELALKFEHKQIPTDVLADFWHGTPNLYAVKHTGVVTYELKRKLRKRNWRTVTKMNIQFIPCWFIFYFMSWLLMAHLNYTGT